MIAGRHVDTPQCSLVGKVKVNRVNLTWLLMLIHPHHLSMPHLLLPIKVYLLVQTSTRSYLRTLRTEKRVHSLSKTKLIIDQDLPSITSARISWLVSGKEINLYVMTLLGLERTLLLYTKR